MFDIIPKNTTVGTINLAGVILTTFLSNVPMYPELSAIPIPNIPTKTTPSGANPVKLDTAFSIIYLKPSPLRSDTAFIV